MNDETKLMGKLETKLHRISYRSSEDKKASFNFLMPLFTEENLISCFNELDGKKAVGIDKKTKEEYGKEIVENVRKLVSKMKNMSYQPNPVKEVLIPKANGKMRPLGISVIEDKMVQSLYSKILESIYEPIFKNCSFGFRRRRSAHDAIKEVTNTCFHERVSHVIDLDLENFFGSIDQDKLVALLKLKIKDERFLRYLTRMLKAGILRENRLVKSDVGTPQGSMVSPALANIFGHYCLDLWFEETVAPRCLGKIKLVRYCDDAILLCEREEDVARVMKALKGRLDRFGLKLNDEKTKVVSFNRRLAGKTKQGTFSFLGFTFFIGRSRKGIQVPKVKTNTKTFSAKLKNVEIWCKRNRDAAKLVILWKVFCLKLQGHINYYCVSYNTYKVKVFVHKARKIFLKWMNRRSQRRSMSWEKFLMFESRFPPPPIRTKFRLF